MTTLQKSSIFSNPQIPQELVTRMTIQTGDGKLDLSKCLYHPNPLDEKLLLQVIRDYYDTTPLDLNISGNQICSLSPQFSLNLIYLTKLNCSRNNIKALPDNFGLLIDLMYLDLSDNQLETLPVSMRKMTRLSSLFISGNPLCPPLQKLVDEPRTTPLTLAKQVVKFLNNLAKAVTQSPGGPRGVSPLGIRTLSKIHYSSGSSMYVDGDAGPDAWTPSASSCTSEDQNKADDDETEYKNFQTRPILFNPVFLIAFWISLFPLFFAYFVEISYLDWLAEEYPSFQSTLMWYKPYHEVAALITDWIPRCDSLFLKGPPPPPVVENVGMFSSIWMRLRNWF